jgi:hypothetical protein
MSELYPTRGWGEVAFEKLAIMVQSKIWCSFIFIFVPKVLEFFEVIHDGYKICCAGL